ncbi:MBL fold metallo-hydrolase [Paenibacillus sp. HB172176]|uniref:MBL fold metallo-hydrolase n=1 Tax=Paenibacillus sp. HB172176 TaxID=2493690 RepID=UPI00143BD4DB|nr:MBL fold metallo-hydrolase [Paenibacillus sp. HB172176]
MKIADGIEVLEISMEKLGNPMVLNLTAVYDGDSAVLIDTAMPGFYGEIMALLQQIGVQESDLRAIILTHQDIDHIGGLPELLAESGNELKIYAHAEDKPYIDGEIPFLKFGGERKEGMLQAMPEKRREQFVATFSADTPSVITDVLKDGEELPFGGGLLVVHTPGHTPGHACFYHKRSKTLVAADAMVVANGELHGPNPANTPNREQAIESLKKLKAFDIDTVICYHGGVYRGDVSKRIDEIMASTP